MQLAHYLRLLHSSELSLAAAFELVAAARVDEVDVKHSCDRHAGHCHEHARELKPFIARYDESASDEPEHRRIELFAGPHRGELGLLRDLHDLYLLATQCSVVWTVIGQAAQGARDQQLLHLVHICEAQTTMQAAWLKTRMKSAATQALIVA